MTPPTHATSHLTLKEPAMRPRHHRAIDVMIVTFALTFAIFSWAVFWPDDSSASTLPTGRQTCATINNVTNRAAWVTPVGTQYHLYRATYDGDNVDRWGRLVFDAPVPRAVRLAALKLTTGGPAIARACTPAP